MPRWAPPWWDQVDTFQMLPKALHPPKIFQKRRSLGVVAIIVVVPAHAVDTVVIEIGLLTYVGTEGAA